MTRTMSRSAIVLVGVLPMLVAALTVRPADGQEPLYGFYAMTMRGGSTFIEGEVGAGGGLAVLDGGAPFGSGRLDSSPSAAVRAAAVEPGTLVRTVAGVANGEFGEQVIDIPVAEAQFPGTPEGSVEGTGDQDAGGFTARGGTANVTAGADAITARATGSSQVVLPTAAATRIGNAMAALRAAYPALTSPAPSAQDGTATTEGAMVAGAASAAADGTLYATFTSRAEQSSIMGEVVFGNVIGTATVTTLPDGTREAEATIDVGSMTVAGMPVAFGSEGLVVLGQEVIPGQDLQAAAEAVTGALAASGITVEPLTPVEVTEEGSARADSRGVRVTIVNPGVPDRGIPSDRITYVLGGAAVTISDEPPFQPPAPLPVDDTGPPPTDPTPPPPPPPAAAPPPATSSSGGRTTTVTTTARPPAVSATSAPRPVAAPPATVSAPVAVDMPLLVAGRRVDKPLAIAAFGAWQLLSLSICTAAVLSMRRRRYGP